MNDSRAEPFVGYRVEYRPPAGPARPLAQTTILSMAHQTAYAWRNRLERKRASGHVTIVVVPTGEALVAYALEPSCGANRPIGLRATTPSAMMLAWIPQRIGTGETPDVTTHG